MKVEFNTHEFPSVGFISADIPEEFKTIITEELLEISNDREKAKSYNGQLAGHLRTQYAMPKLMKNDLWERYVLTLVQGYGQQFPNYERSIDYCSSEMALTHHETWANFQRKGEFQPIHSHHGVFSYVVWIDIPYDLGEELRYYGEEMKDPRTSLFHFVVTNHLGEVTDVPLYIDSTWEWKIAVFPAKMRHFVNPFMTSDKERISISGNLTLESMANVTTPGPS